MKKPYLIGALLVVLAAALFLLLRTPSTPQSVLAPPAAAPAADALPEREMTLYFASGDGRYLVAAASRLRCDNEAGCLRAVVEALIAGPDGGLQPVLPPRTLLRGLQVAEETLTLDFDAQLVAGHPGGSQAELLTAYALVNTVAVNFPHLRQVALTVDGQPLSTLRGHLDLTRPLLADFSFARPPSAAAEGGSPR